MNSYLSLVPISAKVHKRQSRMTRLCIILAVFLVVSIFSMADMWLRAEKISMINKQGNYHIILQDMPGDKAEQIRKRSEVAVSSWYDEINTDVNQDYYINGKNAVLYGIEETYLGNIMNYPVEGSYPESDGEVLLSADAKKLFGIKVGDDITLSTPARDFSYTVSGFSKDDEEFNDIIDGSCVYMNQTAFHKICKVNKVEPASRYYIRFKENINLKKTINDIKEHYSLISDNIDENTAVLGLAGASSNKSMNNIYSLAVVCFLLILISGVLMISSCMNSNVAQRTKFFGMLRCIGADKKQIIRFVRLEALNWCKTAIPTGCLCGMATCWILCAVLHFLVKGEWADMPLFGVSVSGIACGAAVGIITVFIAAHSPAKQAAKVSPVSAVSGNSEILRHVSHAANTRFFKVETSLGIHHATTAKKNLVLMTGSFALTIVLFLAFSACLDIVHKLIPSVGKFTPGIAITSQNDTNSIDRSLEEEIKKITGVETAFGTMIGTEYPVEINGRQSAVDLFSYGKIMLENSKKSVISGDLSKVYGDSGYALAIFNQSGNSLDVGDKIKFGDEEVEIACVLSEGVGGISDSATVVCSEETFMRLTGEQNYAMVSVVLQKDVSEATVDEIHSLAGDNLFTDNRAENNEVYGSYWVFRLAAYGFLAIISFITVLNIMNSISMGVSSRIKQYGTMRAVGMESRQVTKMISSEAATYAACGTMAGIFLGLLLHYLIYAKVLITHFGGTWKIPVTTIAIILLLVLVSCVAAVHAPAKRLGNMAITDTINEL